MSKSPEESSWKTSYSLINRLRNPDDQDSWKEFVSHYEQYVYNILRRFGVTHSDTEELCQEIMLKLWQTLPEFDYDKNRGKFRQWLSTIIRNRTCNYLNKNSRQRELLEENHSHILSQLYNADESSKLDKLIDDEWELYLSNAAWRLVRKRFSETAQQVFIMSVEGHSISDIAAKCSITENAVAVFKNRVKNSLKYEISKLKEQLM